MRANFAGAVISPWIAAAALAQPTPFVDLGTLATGTVSPSYNAQPGQIKWYKLTLPPGGATIAGGVYLDITTQGAPNPAFTNSDTEIALYSGAGALIANDDDDGPGFASSLTFGLNTPIRPNGTGADHDGRDGELPAASYWLAVTGWDASFDSIDWSVSTNSVDTGNITTLLTLGNAATPSNPSGAGSVTPTQIASCGGGSAVVSVVVTPGANPPSTALAVSADATSVGAGLIQLRDDGVSPDATAADNIFSATLAAGLGIDGSFVVPFTVTDAQLRSGNGSIVVSVDSIGQLPSTARSGNATSTITAAAGAGDVDMFAICVTNPANFQASTVGGASWDTSLFLFNPSGAGVVMNDDEPTGLFTTSRIIGFPLPQGGLYFIAVAGFDRDPVNSLGQEIWADLPYSVVRAPDAPAVTNLTLASWAGLNTGGGAYQLTLSGATTSCPADLDDDGIFQNGGRPDCGVDINDLLFFLSGFEAGSSAVDLDNDGNPATGIRDCGIDINDLLYFLSRFESGC